MSLKCDKKENMCFVCLESCKHNFCSVCTCCAHPKCLKQYVDSREGKEVCCPVCKAELRVYKTRKKTEERRWWCLITYIKKMIWFVETESESSKKKFICKQLFKVIVKNKYLIKNRSLKLFKTMKEKLTELYHKDNWTPAYEYLFKLEN